MNDTHLSAARDLVQTGITLSGVPLSHTLEYHLSAAVARFMTAPVDMDRFTVRLTVAMDKGASREKMRFLGDECLIGCAFFSGALRRKGGSIRRCAEIGQTAYDSAGLLEAALAFPHMLDVLGALSPKSSPECKEDLLDMARAGSVVARKNLSSSNIIPFRRKILY